MAKGNDSVFDYRYNTADVFDYILTNLFMWAILALLICSAFGFFTAHFGWVKFLIGAAGLFVVGALLTHWLDVMKQRILTRRIWILAMGKTQKKIGDPLQDWERMCLVDHVDKSMQEVADYLAIKAGKRA